MPEHAQIERELRVNRDDTMKLIDRQLPVLGECKFGEYFTAAIGETLYRKFMADYTWKMWNIPGDELETSMVWADRFQGEKTGAPKTTNVQGYDPLKFESFTLGKGLKFQIDPKQGWASVWDAMAARSTVIRDRIVGIHDSTRSRTSRPRAARSTTSATTTRSSARSISTCSGARTRCRTLAGCSCRW